MEAIFTLAEKLQPSIIFVDEIDAFLRSRSSTDYEASALVKAQFMTLWDGFATDPKSRVVVVGATNRPEDVDRAILRRMPRTCRVGLPVGTKGVPLLCESFSNTRRITALLVGGQDESQRCKILQVILRHEKVRLCFLHR